MMPLSPPSLLLTTGVEGELFTLALDGLASKLTLTPPRFEVNGVERSAFRFVSKAKSATVLQHGNEILLTYREEASEPALTLTVAVRLHDNSSFVRFRYTLHADTEAQITKQDGKDNLTYFGANATLDRPALTEIQLSHFDPVAHSYLPYRLDKPFEEQYAPHSFAGPIAIYHTSRQSALLAYEHGADYPDSFLKFKIDESGIEDLSQISLVAHKGNYPHGYTISPETAFNSVWFEAAVVAGDLETLLREYRRFFLEEVADNNESRKPYLFYNTWNHQERLKYFEGKPYLTDMTFERMMAEIEVAHKIGIEVFVIDTGWYHKTGDWQVNLERFPDGLQEIRQKLDFYGMKLGLWFNPVVAAQTSEVFLAHREWVQSRDGKESYWGEIWETEASYGMCLASDYADHFIETMVRLNRELGVSYFKWDAIGQYGCNSPHHRHGTDANSEQERADCYAYEMGRSMIRIVEEATRRAPGIIVDFDITEGGRFVGLGFLSVGKYFLINNGPYFHDFDIPKTVKMEPNTINVLFYPGAVRPRVCRQSYRFDTVIPSVLFLTHFLPDAPKLAQNNSVAALALGGNGIWGDLVGLGEDAIDLLSKELTRYKTVADAVTGAYPRVTGFPGSSPEIHEKLDAETGSGLIAFFTVKAGTFQYVTQPITRGEDIAVEGVEAYEILPDGRLKLTVVLEQNGARLVTVHLNLLHK